MKRKPSLIDIEFTVLMLATIAPLGFLTVRTLFALL